MSTPQEQETLIGTDPATGVAVWGHWEADGLHVTRILDITGEELDFDAHEDRTVTVTMPFEGSRTWGIGPYGHEDQEGAPDGPQ